MHEDRNRQHQRDYPSAARHGGGVYLPMRFRLRLNMAQHAPVNSVNQRVAPPAPVKRGVQVVASLNCIKSESGK